MITTEIDTSRLTVRLNELQAALIGQGQSGDMRVILKGESRLLAQTLMRDTPPQNLKQGRTAVKRDLGNLFRAPIGTGKIMGPGLDILARGEEYVSAPPAILARGSKGKTPMEYLQEYIRAGDIAKIGTMFRRMNIIGQPRSMSQAEMHTHHKAHRNRRGRVTQVPASGILMPLKGLGKYIAYNLGRVGRMKSGWAPAVIALGGKVASWVKRHVASQPPGYVLDMMASENNPSVTIVNNADGIETNVGSRVKGALRERERAITLKIQLVVSGYAKDVAQGIKIKRRAVQTAELAIAE